LKVKVHAANIHDTKGGGSVFEEAVKKYPSLKWTSADEGYKGTFVDFVTNTLGKAVEISKKISVGWTILAKRWVVERTFAWLNNFRRLAKDFEKSISSAENMLIIAHIMILLGRF
jgi:putative transposase